MLLFCHIIVQFVELSLGILIFRKIYPAKREHSMWVKIVLSATYIVWGLLFTWNAWMAYVSNSFVIINSLVLSIWILQYLRNSYFLIFIWQFFYNVTLALVKMLLLVLEGASKQETLHKVNLEGRNFKEVIWCLVIYLSLIHI